MGAKRNRPVSKHSIKLFSNINMWPFKKKNQVIITFIEGADGKQTGTIKVSKGISASHAIGALDKLKWDIEKGIVNRCHARGLSSKDPQTRKFINKLKLDEVL